MTDDRPATALEYLQHGWSVIPLQDQGKRPLLAWQVYQKVRVSQDAARRWWDHGPANLGIVTGKISGLVVLDIDGERGRHSLQGRELPVTPVARTGAGWHYYFTHPGRRVENAVGILPGVDLRGDGGYVVAPPSVHQSGQRYEWMLDPWGTPLAPLPDWLCKGGDAKAQTAQRNGPGNWPLLLRTPVPEGRRNQTLTRIAGYLLRGHGFSAYAALELVYAWNKVYCTPPLGRDEVTGIFNSIATREVSRRMRRDMDA